MNMIDAMVPYAAGFFDGEGCIHIRSRGELYIGVSQLDPRPLKVFEYLFDGGVSRFRNKDRKYFYYRWDVTGDKASDALRKMLPFLVVKKDQADLAVEFQSLPWRGRIGRLGKTEEQRGVDLMFSNRMKELKREGRDVA